MAERFIIFASELAITARKWKTMRIQTPSVASTTLTRRHNPTTMLRNVRPCKVESCCRRPNIDQKQLANPSTVRFARHTLTIRYLFNYIVVLFFFFFRHVRPAIKLLLRPLANDKINFNGNVHFTAGERKNK